jgi:iron complex transport system ATP-binding protein
MSALVEFHDVGFAYRSAFGRAGRGFQLGGVTFTLAPGDILGVIGPNSAGKTTLIRLLTKVIEPDRGEITVDGHRLAGLGRPDLACRIAVVPQEVPAALPFTVEQLVLMGRFPHAPRRFFERAGDVAAARRAMALTGVSDLAPVAMEALSGGERQRVMLARALAQEPRLLVLDEPTAHLDLRYQAECVRLLRRVNAERGVGALLVSHDLNLAAEVSDRLLLLSEGRVARLGAPAEVLDPALLSHVYECEVIVERSPATGRPLVQVAWPARVTEGGATTPSA